MTGGRRFEGLSAGRGRELDILPSTRALLLLAVGQFATAVSPACFAGSGTNNACRRELEVWQAKLDADLRHDNNGAKWATLRKGLRAIRARAGTRCSGGPISRAST